LAHAVKGDIARPGFLTKMGSLAIVNPQVVGLEVIGDKNIRPAVAVEIGAEHAESMAGCGAEPRRKSNIAKADGSGFRQALAPEVAIQLGDAARKHIRVAVIRPTALVVAWYGGIIVQIV